MLYIHEYTPHSCYTYVILHVYSIVIQKCSVYSIHAPCMYNMRTRVYCACITKEFMRYTVLYNFNFPHCQVLERNQHKYLRNTFSQHLNISIPFVAILYLSVSVCLLDFLVFVRFHHRLYFGYGTLL